jgi:hypothetical protein
MEIRRIHQTEAEAVTDLWDEAGRSVPDGGPLKECGRRNIAAMLVLAASHPVGGAARRAGCRAARGARLRGGDDALRALPAVAARQLDVELHVEPVARAGVPRFAELERASVLVVDHAFLDQERRP